MNSEFLILRSIYEEKHISQRDIAKALDVSIKSLFEDACRTEGFIAYKGKILRFNSRDELNKIFQ